MVKIAVSTINNAQPLRRKKLPKNPRGAKAAGIPTIAPPIQRPDTIRLADDIFDDIFNEEVFDFIWSNGVLHHTKDPYLAFKILTKNLKQNGYILIGLYNKFGRLRTIFRRFLYKIFGKKIVMLLDPTLRNLKNDEQIISWIRDQYMHPVESLHTIDEVIKWFDYNNIEFISSIPSCDLTVLDEDKIFHKQTKGNFFYRLLSQIIMLFGSLGSDGGLFILIGKKRPS